MTRKHADDKDKVDPTQVAWRSFMTAITLAITTLTGYIAAHTSSSDTSGLASAIVRIEHRLDEQDKRLAEMSGDLKYVTAFVDGMRKTTH